MTGKSSQLGGAGGASRALAGKPLQAVVIATDFSAGAERAVRRVASLPLADTVRVDIVHVVPDTVKLQVGALRNLRGALTDEAAHLDMLLDSTGQRRPRIENYIIEGRPDEAILRHAQERQAELLVTGRRGAGGLRELLLGSTAERIVRGGVAPVLLVGGPVRRAYRRPLVAVDVGAPFVPIVEYTMRLLPAELRTLEVVTAYELPLERRLRTREPDTRLIRKLRRERAAECRQVLSGQLIARVPASVDLRIVTRHGLAQRVIARTAERQSADLIAMGSRCRRGLARFLLGSVAREVLQLAKVDVLVVPPTSGRERASW